MKRIAVITFFMVVFAAYCSGAVTHQPVVADSANHQPLVSASVFDSRGHFLGVTDRKGKVSCAVSSDYPLTFRYMGYNEARLATPTISDTIFLSERVSELPEVMVEARSRRVLHLLAYVIEYSTLATYTDTITLFREKMVDYMLPEDHKSRFKGWHRPRVMNARSYYRFTDASGRDSVSDRCNQHFSWTDWITLPPQIALPDSVAAEGSSRASYKGKYFISELWNRKDNDRVTVQVDVLASDSARRWVPGLATFFSNNDVDFERLQLMFNFDNVVGSSVTPLELTGFSFNIESRGRGHGMFMFNRVDEPLFVTSYTEVYILDKEFITEKEARRWERKDFSTEEVAILEPMEAPDLQPSTLALIERVDALRPDSLRLALVPDQRLVGRHVSKANFNLANRALSMLKTLTGITLYKSHKNFNRRWRSFTNDWKNRRNPKTKD